jgi:DNA adenine methylase
MFLFSLPVTIRFLPKLLTPRVPTQSPPLKWAGGKRWLVPYLDALWQPFKERRYVEPFCGGLAIALGLQPRRALLNDANPHLINFYRQLQQGLELTVEMRNEKELFYQHRERFNELTKYKNGHDHEAAQLFYYLNRTCFNGLCRFNKDGEFNVPFGRYTRIRYKTDFIDYKKPIEDWTFSNFDVAKLKFKSGDFIYADPPYDVEFTTYSSGGFSWDDQVRTAELLAKQDGPVAISNQATKRIVRLYKDHGFKIRFLQGPRRISRTGDRTAAREVLATKGI